MKFFKVNKVLENLYESEKGNLKEDFWNPGKYFKILQDMVDIDTEKWSNANQKERDEMVRPLLQEFWDKYKEEMTEEDIYTLLDDMEDSNYHTEGRVLEEIIYGKNRLKNILKDLAAEYDTPEEVTDALRSLQTMGEISDKDYNIIQANWDEWLNEATTPEKPKKLHESSKLNCSRFYNTEGHEDYIDIDDYGIVNTSVGKIIDKKAQGLIQIEGTTYVIVSNTESGEPVLEAYSVDYQFPYIFKLDK